jgi:hypothetical protein
VTLLLPAASTFLVIGVLGVVAWLVLKKTEHTEEARSRALSEVRQLLWGDAPRESATDLLERNRILFIGMQLHLEHRLDHRLEDAGGAEIGSSLRQPRPGLVSRGGAASRFETVRVEICGENQVKQLEIVRRSGVRRQPLEIFDGTGTRVGTIARDGRRSFAMRDASGARIGTIVRRSGGYTVDYALLDAFDVDVGFISDFPHVIERASVPVSNAPATSRRWPSIRIFAAGQPPEHVLELRLPASRTFRSLMLGAAASVYLTLQDPCEDGG